MPRHPATRHPLPSFHASRLFLPLLLAGTLGFVACGEASDTGPTPEPAFAAKADGSDVADQSCQIVLRSVELLQQNGWYTTTCDLGVEQGDECHYVFEGFVDVMGSQGDDFESVNVLFHTDRSPHLWFAAPATMQGQAYGWTRYRFQITSLTPSTYTLPSDWQETYVEVAPFLRTADGRIFDHNRVDDPLGSYRLDASTNWRIRESEVCTIFRQSAHYFLTYPDFFERLEGGPVRPGGRLKVTYDGQRLRERDECFAGEGSAWSTTIMMGYLFDDDETTASTALIEQVVGGAYPSQDTREPVLEIPTHATSVSMWFYCVPGFSYGGEEYWQYDSNHGANYVLPVVPDLPDEPDPE